MRASLGFDDSHPAATGIMTEAELEAMLKNKQALLEKVQLDENDPLQKLMNNHDQIIKGIKTTSSNK